jgi:hypothetical protein
MARARAQAQAFAGDRAALDGLSAIVEPDRLRPLRWRMELGAGTSSNAALGSANDPTSSAGVASGLFTVNAWVQVAPDFGGVLRPALEFGPRVTRYSASGARDLSFVNLTGRVGVLLDWGLPRLLLAYRPDFLRLDLGDRFGAGPLWSVGAHRGELEVELAPWLMAFGGAGERAFRELGRTRAEVDLGVGGGAALLARLSLLWAASWRKHWARDVAYDLDGASAIVGLQAALPAAVSARLHLSFGADFYPSSAGFFAAAARRDLAFKVAPALWSPPLPGGVRLGVSYEYSQRWSTAQAFEGSDHRATLRLLWTGATDLGGPAVSPREPLGELRWAGGRESGDGGDGDRIQDLLRQDEQVRPSCGCGG